MPPGVKAQQKRLSTKGKPSGWHTLKNHKFRRSLQKHTFKQLIIDLLETRVLNRRALAVLIS